MNRSLTRAATRAARRTWDWDVHGAGRVTFVAVFPRTGAPYLGIDGDGTPFGDFAGGLDLDGFRPIGDYRWWRPDDPARVWGAGTAAVALRGYNIDGHVKPDELWYAHFDPDDDDHRYPGVGWYGGILDKPHRIRSATGARMVTDPEEFGAATALWDLIEKEHGFAPIMDAWLFDSHDFDGKWYMPLEWEADERSCELADVVELMDGWRRRYGAKIHVYGKPTDRYGTHSGPSDGHMHHAQSATEFLRSYKAWRSGDLDNWHPDIQAYW